MSRKLILLMCIALLLGLSGDTSAALKGWWKLDEGSGSTAADSSGNGFNGTITGASWYNDGTRGYVLDFDGADYISIPSTAVNLTGTVTVAAWVYGDAALQPQENSIFEGTRSGSRTLSAHVPWSNGHIIWDAGYAGTTYDRVDKAADSTNQYESQWNHWAFTKDTSSGQMKMYINGTMWTSATGKTKSMSGINSFKIGSKADGTLNYDGMISDFRVYDTVLSDTEIKVLAGWTRTIAGTVGTVDGVTMNGLPGSPVTSGGGAYIATVEYGWSGTVTPTKTSYTFSPANKTYSNVTANQSAQNYTPTATTYAITGTVGSLDGVTMGGLPGSPVTSGGGNYTATVVYGWTGTATPSKTGYTFSPTNKTYSNVTSDQTSQTYTPTLLTYVISGTVGSLDGVTMGGLPGTPVTSGGGNYTATVVYGWSGTVTPSYGSYGFNPANKTYSNVTANQSSQNYGIIADVDLLGCWNFDNSDATDDSGYEHNGTLTGNAAIVDDGERGKVLWLDGAGDYVDLGNGSWTNPGNNITIAAWFKVDAFTDAYQTIIAKGLDTYRLGRNSSGNTLQVFMNYNASSYRILTTNTNVNDNRWHHTAVTYDGSTMKIYIDGKQEDTNTLSTLYTTTANLCIGRSTGNTARDWQGWIDDVRVYKKALTSAEIAVLGEATYIISGTVGTVDGVTMAGLPNETITSGGGLYSATVAGGWTGTVTPQKEGYTFSPTNKTYSNVTSDQSSQNYTPSLVTYTISGHVGSLDGVTMNGLPGNPSTSGGGAYTATVTTTWSGTVTPAKTGYTFSPTSRMYSNVGANLTEDYTPIINTYTISGNVGTISGVTMSGLPGDPVSSTGGAYSGTVAYGWSGTVTPTRANCAFSPTNKTYSNVTSDLVEQDYTTSTTIPDESLVGWWPFNGDSEDYSGYGHDGTVTGASYVSSDMGTVLEFDGVDYVSIPSTVFSTINDHITIALWQYGDVDLQPQNTDIFEGWDSSNHRVLNAHLPFGTSVVYWDAGYAGTTYDRINKTATAAQYEGQWNHWVFTKDLTTDQMKIYLNGALWHSGTGKSKSMSGITQFKIGSAADGAYNYDGMICEFRIYNRTMSDTEISDLYNASYEATGPSPVDDATSIATSADLSWTAGYLAGEHDVYFGTNAALVTNRDQAVFKGIQSGTTYDPGTLQNGMTYYWAVDEVNDFYENSPWAGDVWSFTTVGAGTTCPLCGGQGECDLNVTNYNGRLGRITGVQKVNIIRVAMAGYETPSMSSIHSSVNNMMDFCNRTSYGRLQMQLGVSVNYVVPVGSFSTTQSRAVTYEKSLPDSLICAIFWPKGLAKYSHSGGGNIYMMGNLTRDVIHESGHILGLAHSNSNINGDFHSSGDSSSFMGIYSAQNYTVNQQHWLGWLKDYNVIKINDCLNKVPYIDVPITPVSAGGVITDNALACVYEIPDSDQRIWISIPKNMGNNVNQIRGGEIFIYRATECQGCTGMAMGSVVIGRIGDPKTAGPKEIEGLIIDPVSYKSTPGVYNGDTVDNFSEVTLRISLANQPPVIDPNDYNEPGKDCIANWNFSEAASTVLRNTVNNGLTTPATWTADRTGITTTGDETLLYRPTTNTIDGSVTYFDLAGIGSGFTSGKVWTVVEVNDFNFAGTVGERLRFGMTNAMANGNVTAEFHLRRVASNSIHLMGYAGGTLPITGVQICGSNTFAGQLEVCTEYDFDAHTYQIFYRVDGTGNWTSIGAASAMYSGRVGNAIRLCAGDDASTGTGSWADTGEYFHINRIYLTDIDPKIEPANVAPSVSIVTPNDGDTFAAGSNITLYGIADDTDGNVATLQFYRGGTTLIGQGQISIQPEIAATAGQATIHGATAQYEPAGGNIGYWNNVNDWISWSKTVTRPSTFEVWMNYACPTSSAGATYRVEVGDQHVHGTVVGTSTSGWTTYDSALLGTVTIADAGQVAINVIPETKPGTAVMNLRDVTLIPLDEDEAYQYVWTNVPSGTYTLTAKSTDDDDANTISEPVVITVQP